MGLCGGAGIFSLSLGLGMSANVAGGEVPTGPASSCSSDFVNRAKGMPKATPPPLPGRFLRGTAAPTP